MKKVIIIGAGGHAKVVIDILLQDSSVEITGCVASDEKREVMGFPVLGTDHMLEELYEEGYRSAFVAIGDNNVRERLANKSKALGFTLINAVSSFSYIANSVELGSGVAVMPGAVINAGARILDNAIINTRASIDHDCIIGRSVHVAPGCTLSGNVVVGDRTFLGTGCNVINGIKIGSDCMVGAGAVVTRSIEKQTLSVGVPARVIKMHAVEGN